MQYLSKHISCNECDGRAEYTVKNEYGQPVSYLCSKCAEEWTTWRAERELQNKENKDATNTL